MGEMLQTGEERRGRLHREPGGLEERPPDFNTLTCRRWFRRIMKYLNHRKSVAAIHWEGNMSRRRYSKYLASLGTSIVLLSLLVNSARAAAGDTTRVSVSSDGTEGNAESGYASISNNGRYVAFESLASNLESGDTNGFLDIFVHNQLTGETALVSVASDGTQGNQGSGEPSISADGRYVAFMSYASNLVSGDTNDNPDIFVHDQLTGETTIVSVASDGTQANNNSDWLSISADGRYVAFQSYASNLVSGDTNQSYDIFVHDRQTEQTTRVSVASDGTQGNDHSQVPSLSADGRYVAFDSAASNLVSGDTNNNPDIFVHDRQTGETTLVSVASDGTQGNGGSADFPSISADGRYVGFSSHASNLVSGDTNGITDIFIHDRLTGETTLASVASDGTQGNAISNNQFISADGRYVAFMSNASNLVSGDTNGTEDIFVHNRQTGETKLASISSNGTGGNSSSRYPTISANGRYVAFLSGASNLVSGDTNDRNDVFVHENDIPNCIISGNAGMANATLSFDDGGPQTVTAYSNGYYFLEVSNNWSGSVTPYKTSYTFTPGHREYTNVINDQIAQDYLAIPWIYMPLISK